MSLPGRGAAAGGEASASASASRKRGRDAGDDFSDVRRAIQAMETTFVTIHDLTYDANILYASTSIADVLEWKPEDVVGRSCWEYFHPEEIPFARAIHGRGIELDKASVLNYCRIKNKYGDWVGCECVFTVVYNVLVGCTSVYMDGPKAKKRAVEAPVVRQLFSSSPRDPRYHMLQYISSKFASGPRPHLHEPRAALFLNRFTRTLTVNFATNGLESLLGIPASELIGQSFYYCIQENCLGEAIRCLESAKANDSIAYLRFWFRDPRGDSATHHDIIIDDVDGSSSDEDGGVQIAPRIEIDGDPPEQAVTSSESSAPASASGRANDDQSLAPELRTENSRHSSGNSTDMGPDSANQVFDQSPDHEPSTPRSIMSLDSPELRTPPRQSHRGSAQREARGSHQEDGTQDQEDNRRLVELEAVVSCTSDGLVVIMRAARPFVPDSVRVPPQRAISPYSNGLFASPWATNPILPDPSRVPTYVPRTSTPSTVAPQIASMGTHPAFAPPPSAPTSGLSRPPLSTAEPAVSGSGPPLVDFMNSIRDVAVFAWALTGINGSLQQYGKGTPLVGSVPHTGLPIWDPDGSLAEQERRGGSSRISKADGETITVKAAAPDNLRFQNGTGADKTHKDPDQLLNDTTAARSESGAKGHEVAGNRSHCDGVAQNAPHSTAEHDSNKVPEVKEAEIGGNQQTTAR